MAPKNSRVWRTPNRVLEEAVLQGLGPGGGCTPGTPSPFLSEKGPKRGKRSAQMTDRKRKLDVFSDAPPANGAAAGGVPTVNPFTGRAYSTRYYDILGKRRGEAACDAGVFP